MLELPTVCDSLIFQFLSLGDLLNARTYSRASLQRFDPRKSKPVWRIVCPSTRNLGLHFNRASLKLLEFLAAAYEFTPEQARQSRLLLYACRRAVAVFARGTSEFEPLKRLADTYKFECDDARKSDMFILRQACWGGHLELVQWLVNYFKITKSEVWNCRAFQITCEHGHLDLAKWLDRCGLGISDTCAVGPGVLRDACGNGHLAVVQWLVTRFNFDTTDAIAALRTLDNRQAHDNSATQWLRRVFSL
jgi:hypothetical protein